MKDEIRNELNQLLMQSFGSGSGQDARTTFCPLPIIQKLSQPHSIAVHVRRGDFLRIPVFHVCDEPYYRQSMNEMRARVPDARFFIFSDDPTWCRTTFTDPDTEVIDRASSNPLHDLHLMSHAGHHIIANSSYSWWAAWLGEKSDQNVIMPDRWYAKDIHAPIEEKRWK